MVRASSWIQCGDQWRELRLETAPAPHRTGEQRLAYLYCAGGCNPALAGVEGQAAIIPRQPAVLDHAPGFPRQVCHHVFVCVFEHVSRRKDVSPVIHQLAVATIIVAEFCQVVAELLALVEELGETGQTGIERISADVDDPGIRQDRAD